MSATELSADAAAGARRPLTAWSAGAWAIYLGWIVITLDTGALNLALPTIARQLHASGTGIEWVANAYTLPLASLLLLGGHLGDRLGAARLFRIAALGFAAATVLSGLSPSLGVLIAARAWQGVCAAALLPMVLALIAKTIPDPDERAKAVNLMTVFGGAALAVGPFLGGLLTDTIGWRFVFWLTVPVAVGAATLVRTTGAAGGRGAWHVDLSGQIVGALGLTLAVAGLIEVGDHRWDAPLVLGPFLTGLATLAAFIAIERRAPDPIVPLRVFRHRRFRAATLGGFAFQFGAYGLQFFLALHVQRAWGLSPLLGGLVLVPNALATVGAGVLLNPRLLARGPRHMLIVGAAVALAGVLLMLALRGAGSWPLLVAAELLVGSGTGIYSTALNQLTGTALGPAQGGIASGIYNTARQTGQAVAIAVLGALAATATLAATRFAVALCALAVALILAIGLRAEAG